jgi:hypothetical protein
MSFLQRSKSIVVEVCAERTATREVRLFRLLKINGDILTSEELGQRSTDLFPYFSFCGILRSLTCSRTMQDNFPLVDEG